MNVVLFLIERRCCHKALETKAQIPRLTNMFTTGSSNTVTLFVPSDEVLLRFVAGTNKYP